MVGLESFGREREGDTRTHRSWLSLSLSSLSLLSLSPLSLSRVAFSLTHTLTHTHTHPHTHSVHSPKTFVQSRNQPSPVTGIIRDLKPQPGPRSPHLDFPPTASRDLAAVSSLYLLLIGEKMCSRCTLHTLSNKAPPQLPIGFDGTASSRMLVFGKRENTPLGGDDRFISFAESCW